MQQHIRVRNFHSCSLKTKENTDIEEDIQYDIDDKYVNIYTSHFSLYIVTAEGINCCASSVLAQVMGSLRNIRDAKPLASVKICLSSILYQIEDYKKVRKQSFN